LEFEKNPKTFAPPPFFPCSRPSTGRNQTQMISATPNVTLRGVDQD
jgi:hypothetical protein